MTTIISVMMTIKPARVNPRSPALPSVERSSIETISWCCTAHVDDAGRHAGVVAAGIDSRGIVRIGRRRHFFPVAPLRDGILRQSSPAQVVTADERLQDIRIFLFVGVIVVV